MQPGQCNPYTNPLPGYLSMRAWPVFLLIALLLTASPTALSRADAISDTAISELQKRGSFVFFAQCSVTPELKEVVYFPVGEKRGTFLLIGKNQVMTAGGTLLISAGKIEPDDFYGGASDQEQQIKQARLLISQGPFSLLSSGELGAIYASRPSKPCD
jgi:hypothetical protein